MCDKSLCLLPPSSVPWEKKALSLPLAASRKDFQLAFAKPALWGKGSSLTSKTGSRKPGSQGSAPAETWQGRVLHRGGSTIAGSGTLCMGQRWSWESHLADSREVVDQRGKEESMFPWMLLTGQLDTVLGSAIVDKQYLQARMKPKRNTFKEGTTQR